MGGKLPPPNLAQGDPEETVLKPQLHLPPLGAGHSGGTEQPGLASPRPREGSSQRAQLPGWPGVGGLTPQRAPGGRSGAQCPLNPAPTSPWAPPCSAGARSPSAASGGVGKSSQSEAKLVPSCSAGAGSSCLTQSVHAAGAPALCKRMERGRLGWLVARRAAASRGGLELRH